MLDGGGISLFIGAVVVVVVVADDGGELFE